MKESDHIDRIAQFLSGNLSVQEREAFLRWTKESPDNQTLFEEVQKLWGLSEQYAPAVFDTDVHLAWEKVDRQLEAPKGDQKEKAIIRPFVHLRQLLRIAAVFVIVAAGAWLFFDTSQEPANTMAVVETQAEEVKELVLPDGSQVWLNEGSELIYDEKFDQRRVELKGEAFFDIARMEDSPFEIWSGTAKTVVLGTAFNVRAYPTENKVEVAVIRGKVALTETDQPQKAIILEAGNAGTYDKVEKVVKLEKETKANADSWKTQSLVYDNTRMVDVIESLERYFKVKIEVENKAILNCHTSNNYPKPDLKTILNVLGFTFDLEVIIENDRYLLKGQGNACE